MASSRIHHPLPNPSSSIRLVTIDPGWPSESIRVQLIVVPDRESQSAPSYNALSYVWGSAVDADPIECNGISMNVGANLAAALRALRPLPLEGDPKSNGLSIIDEKHILYSNQRVWNGIARNRNESAVIESRRASRGSDMLVWIDAICINQSDPHECAEQVKGMRGIYAAARTVHIWLGYELVAPDGTQLQLPQMETGKVDRTLGRTRLAELGHMPVLLTFLVQALRASEAAKIWTLSPMTRSEQEEVGFPPLDSPEWTILRAFFDQPWFYRVWTVQEAVAAKSSQIVVGDWELDWEPFAKAVSMLGDSTFMVSQSFQFNRWFPTKPWPRLHMEAANYICNIREKNGGIRRLLPLLDKSRGRKSTKAVDHVFAVLGLAEELRNPNLTYQLSTLLTIDYTKPVGHVFRDATRFIIQTHALLLPLAMAGLDEDRSIPDCPTWAPVWSQAPKAMALKSELFNADFGKEMQFKFINANSLRVSGFRFELVRTVTRELDHAHEPGEYGPTSNHYPPRLGEIEFVTSAWNLAKSVGAAIRASNEPLRPPYTTDKAIMDALFYTLSTNDAGSPDGRADSSDEVTKSAKVWMTKWVDGFAPQAHPIIQKVQGFIDDNFGWAPETKFQSRVLGSCPGRRFFLTASGFMGLGPASMKEGDLVVVIFGLKVPFVLRQVGTAGLNRHLLVGECYVHGIMDGELVQIRQREGRPAETFTLD